MMDTYKHKNVLATLNIHVHTCVDTYVPGKQHRRAESCHQRGEGQGVQHWGPMSWSHPRGCPATLRQADVIQQVSSLSSEACMGCKSAAVPIRLSMTVWKCILAARIALRTADVQASVLTIRLIALLDDNSMVCISTFQLISLS